LSRGKATSCTNMESWPTRRPSAGPPRSIRERQLADARTRRAFRLGTLSVLFTNTCEYSVSLMRTPQRTPNTKNPNPQTQTQYVPVLPDNQLRCPGNRMLCTTHAMYPGRGAIHLPRAIHPHAIPSEPCDRHGHMHGHV